MAWIVDIRSVADGWEVQLLDPVTQGAALAPQTGLPFLPEPRHMGRLETTAGNFPILAPESSLQETSEVLALCAGTDQEGTVRIFRRVVSQSIDAGEMKAFGRYLFLVLLGDALWSAITTASQSGTELILSWPAEQSDLIRLPWEMMHGPTDFLAVHRGFSLVRRVAGVSANLRPLQAPPRVLFVIGSGGGDRHFDGLKPGTEYLGILRGIRQGSRALRQLPLVGASPKRLAAAVETFRPDVVHFICHGNPEGGLELVDDDNPDDRKHVNADALYDMLHPDSIGPSIDTGPPYSGPQIVVLSACHSASTGGLALEGAGQVGFPLAVRLVQKGVPMVVGMAGEVADQACRLFGRSFYDSLLTDGRVGFAAARGRRAGLLHGEDGRNRIDWSLPSLFISSSLAEAEVDIPCDANEAVWHRLAQDLAPAEFPAYYARLDVAREFELLMLDEQAQKRLESPGALKTDRQILGLWTDRAGTGRDRFGKSTTLKDLASKAASDGHVPVILTEEVDIDGNWPTEIPGLVSLLVRASRATVESLGLKATDFAFSWPDTLRTLRIGTDPTLVTGLPEEIRSMYVAGSESEWKHMLSLAMQRDLLRYLDEIRKIFDRPRAKLLLLIDDLHLMGNAVPFLLILFGSAGLRAQASRRNDIRVVFAYLREEKRAGEQPAVEAINDFLQQKSYAKPLHVKGFRLGTESRLAYEHVLFRWRRRGDCMSLVPVRRNQAMVEHLFQQLSSTVAGVPSRFNDEPMQTMMDFVIGAPPAYAAVRKADDEDALQRTP